MLLLSHSIVFEGSWRTGEVPEGCRKASVTPVFEKGQEEGSREVLADQPHLSPQVMDQLILGTISRRMKDMKVIRMDHQGEVMLD